MIDYVLVFIMQFLFQFLRVKSNLAIFNYNKIQVVIYSFLIQSLWLLSTFYGMKGLLEEDYLLPLLYLLGGTLGAFVSINNKK